MDLGKLVVAATINKSRQAEHCGQMGGTMLSAAYTLADGGRFHGHEMWNR